MSQMSGPLFTEDRYSTLMVCDTEVDNITRQRTPSQATTVVMSPQRPSSTATVDYLIQGDQDQPAPAAQASNQTWLQTNNFFIPDGTNRHIHDIPPEEKLFHAGQ